MGLQVNDELVSLVHSLNKLYDDRDQGLYRDLEGQLEFKRQRQVIYRKLHEMGVSLAQARDAAESASTATDLIYDRGVTMAHIYHCTEIVQDQYFGYGGAGTDKRRIDRQLLHDTNKTLRALWDLRRKEMCQRQKR